MGDFIFNTILWTLAIFGAFQMLKTILNIYTCTNLKAKGIYLIIAVKNEENKIEGFLRNLLFRVIYGKEENIKNIIVTDLDSTDETANILYTLAKDYEGVFTLANWQECKEMVEGIKNVKNNS